MKRLLIAALGLVAGAAHAQTDATRGQVSLDGRFTRAPFDGGVDATGTGPGVQVRLVRFAPEIGRVGRMVGLQLAVGYDRLNLSAPPATRTGTPNPRLRFDPADSLVVERWNWAHWQRYYRTQIRTLIKDSTESAYYAADLRAVQTVRLYTASVGPTVRLPLGRFELTGSVGLAAAHYRRELYLDERWTKTFPAVAGGYDFDYRLHNEAPDKLGYRLGLDAGLHGSVRLTSAVSFTVGGGYRRWAKRAETDLPLANWTSADLGFSVRY